MADSPPPLDDVDFKSEEEVEVSGEPSEEAKPEPEAVEEEPLFAEMEKPEEPKKEEPKEEEPVEAEHITIIPAPTLEATAVEESPEPEPVVKPKVESAPAPSKPLDEDLFGEDENKTEEEPAQKEEEEEEEEEESDTFELIITITNQEKVGDGMGAYIAYNVLTKTTIPSFKSPECKVKRRFSDFLGLHQKISDKYVQKGYIVPPAPEKSVVGMTKVKLSKSEENNAAFLEKRRASLERYLNRMAKHKVIRKDEDFVEFLENPNDLPKSSDTSALSGAAFMRLVKNVGESISKMAGKKAETDSWFDEQQQNFEVLDAHLRKLHSAIDTMTNSRKDLCVSTEAFSKSVATLGNVEENDSVSRALAKLAEVEEKIQGLHEEQFNSDVFVFGETVRDYIALLTSIKGNFQLRVKAYNNWQSAQTTLAKKRENEVKLQAGGKPEKLAQAKIEIEEWEKKVEEGQKNFDSCSKVLKREVKKFEAERAQEFKQKFLTYLESLMKLQQELIKLWEDYLPDAQAIA